MEKSNCLFEIKPDRGTSLRQNTSEPLEITLLKGDSSNIRVLVEDHFVKWADIPQKENKITLPSKIKYWLINLSEDGAQFQANQDIFTHDVIYDPYRYENQEKPTLEPKEIEEKFDVEPGYVDILPKWYSVKFTYPNHNIIFLRPGVGISHQTHELRNEHWEILAGEPIVVLSDNIFYNVPDHSEYFIPIGTLHTVINPNSAEWVCLKETYTGKFDELDIVRVYNPNDYRDENS